ncbi:MAG TPA: diguanylate cyclase [Bacillaceae bacterium]
MKINRSNPILQNNSLEEQKYKELFKVTEKFHSTMDTSSVLEEMLASLQRVYPDNDYTLLLSHDLENGASLPAKGLEYNSANSAAMAAFLNATIEMEKGETPVLYAPLKGRQGVYGVLEVRSDHPGPMKSSQIDFIRLLANTAGSALENARLYQQSQKLIEDLRLINETSHKLNLTSSLQETIEYLHKQITASFHAKAIGFVLAGENGPDILQGSSQFFHEERGRELTKMLYSRISRELEPLLISNLRDELPCGFCSFESLMAVPMLDGKEMKGLVIVLGDRQFEFSFDQFKLLQALIHRSALAVTNSMLREKLERLVITDQLTQLFARNYLNKAIESSMKKDAKGTFILIDLDNFKEVNDTYGHQTGDEVLIQVAKIIRSNLRSTDIGARWGGEELAIYLPGVSLECGVKVTERLLTKVATQTDPPVTISCGITSWLKGYPDEIKLLFDRADVALYEAKNSGKNRIAVRPVQAVIS